MVKKLRPNSSHQAVYDILDRDPFLRTTDALLEGLPHIYGYDLTVNGTTIDYELDSLIEDYAKGITTIHVGESKFVSRLGSNRTETPSSLTWKSVLYRVGQLNGLLPDIQDDWFLNSETSELIPNLTREVWLKELEENPSLLTKKLRRELKWGKRKVYKAVGYRNLLPEVVPMVEPMHWMVRWGNKHLCFKFPALQQAQQFSQKKTDAVLVECQCRMGVYMA